MALTFVLSDESINGHGTRVLTSGIDLSLFKKNPIALWMHMRAWRGTKDEVLPIGYWENIRKEGDRLLADLVLDEKDEFAVRIKQKVEAGIIRMASIGVNIIATSEERSVLLPGQTRPTVIKCLIKEASVCDIGANRNALKMYDEYDEEINMSDTANHLLPLLSDNQDDAPDTGKPPVQQPPVTEEQTNSLTDDNMEKFKEDIATALDLKDATDEKIIATIRDERTELKDLREKAEQHRLAEVARKEAEVAAYVDAQIKARKATAEQRQPLIDYGKQNFEGLKAMLGNAAEAEDLSEAINASAQNSPDPWEQRFAEIEKTKTTK